MLWALTSVTKGKEPEFRPKVDPRGPFPARCHQGVDSKGMNVVTVKDLVFIISVSMRFRDLCKVSVLVEAITPFLFPCVQCPRNSCC